MGLRLFGIYTRAIRESYEDTVVPPGVVVRLFGKDDERALLAHAKRPELNLNATFVHHALGKGDICAAALVNDEIVSFDWSAFTPTHVRDGVHVYFGPHYRYGYFAYTLPEFRGRHLPRLAVPLRDRYCIERGYTRSISYISVDNWASMRMSKAVGNVRIGFAGYWKAGSLLVPFRTRGVREHGFRFDMPGRDAAR